MKKIKFRCINCGAILTAGIEHQGKQGICSSCKGEIVIPAPQITDSRKSPRFISEKSRLSPPLSRTLAETEELPLCKVSYTETDPVQFALKRKKIVPLLDICDDGLAFLIRADMVDTTVLPGQKIPIEIDFPILVEPIQLNAEVHWVMRMKDKGLLRIGVQFLKPNKEFSGVVDSLIKYMLSRPKRLNTVNNAIVSA